MARSKMKGSGVWIDGDGNVHIPSLNTFYWRVVTAHMHRYASYISKKDRKVLKSYKMHSDLVKRLNKELDDDDELL